MIYCTFYFVPFQTINSSFPFSAERAKWDAIPSSSHHTRKENEIWRGAEETALVSSFPCVGYPRNAVMCLRHCSEPSNPFSITHACRNGYQKFSQEMLSNGELNHLPMKERMGEIGGRWQRLSQKDKDRYKKMAEEKQRQYKVLLEQWLAVLN